MGQAADSVPPTRWAPIRVISLITLFSGNPAAHRCPTEAIAHNPYPDWTRNRERRKQNTSAYPHIHISTYPSPGALRSKLSGGDGWMRHALRPRTLKGSGPG